MCYVRMTDWRCALCEGRTLCSVLCLAHARGAVLCAHDMCSVRMTHGRCALCEGRTLCSVHTCTVTLIFKSCFVDKMDSFPTAHLASDCALGFRLRTWLPTAHLACLSRHLSQYLASDNGVRSLLPRPLSTQRVPVCCIPGCIVTCITLAPRWCPGAGGVDDEALSGALTPCAART